MYNRYTGKDSHFNSININMMFERCVERIFVERMMYMLVNTSQASRTARHYKTFDEETLLVITAGLKRVYNPQSTLHNL